MQKHSVLHKFLHIFLYLQTSSFSYNNLQLFLKILFLKQLFKQNITTFSFLHRKNITKISNFKSNVLVFSNRYQLANSKIELIRTMEVNDRFTGFSNPPGKTYLFYKIINEFCYVDFNKNRFGYSLFWF